MIETMAPVGFDYSKGRDSAEHKNRVEDYDWMSCDGSAAMFRREYDCADIHRLHTVAVGR